MKRKTTDEIKQRIIEQFGTHLDLSKVVYNGDKVHITLGCPKHGEFKITPNNLWKSPCGCPKCSKEQKETANKMTTERFIKQSSERHCGKYDYSKSVYTSDSERVIIICPIHGEFQQLPYHHMSGHGCPKCAGKGVTTEDFVKNARRIHGDKYDYSKVEYKTSKEFVTIICPEHGEFRQRPNSHLRGQGCRRCARERINKIIKKRIMSFDKFVEIAKEIHNDKYIYDESTYVDSHTPLKIKCKECGCEFSQEPKRHVKGRRNGCPNCARKKVGLTQRKTTEEFIADAKKVHGDKYDYSKTEYIKAHNYVDIICKKHGIFRQKPNHHLIGQGCPICNESHLERDVRLFLQENEISYEPQSDVDDLLGRQTADFYLPQYNLAIECQGKQHFGLGGWKKTFDALYYNDIRKQKILSDNNIQLVYYTNEDKDTVFNHETGLYNEANTNFDLNFLEKLITGKDISKEIIDDIKEFIKGFDVEVVENKQIGNIQIDLYIPGIRVGINVVDVNYNTEWSYGITRYHFAKETDECKENGVSLIHLFSDEWFQNKGLVLDKISHILKLDFDKPAIMGRKCVVKEIDKDTAFKFLNENHIQQSVSATVYLGAFFNNEIVAVMTFKQESEGKWDLNRFASDNRYRCQGVGGKMFKHFIVNYDPKEVKSFADRRWTIDNSSNLYTQLGFSPDEILKPEYRYCNSRLHPHVRFHKFGFRKAKLNKKYGLPLDLTESEMCKRIGYDKIWDCGLIRYVWHSKRIKN